MEDEKTVSIVIPAYNAEKFIGDAIKSCLNQTYTPFEINVVIIRSINSTADVVNNLSNLILDKDPKLKTMNIGKGKICANALHIYLLNTNETYVCCLNTGNILIEKNKIQYQIIVSSQLGLQSGDEFS